jgi:hypothetical protein
MTLKVNGTEVASAPIMHTEQDVNEFIDQLFERVDEDFPHRNDRLSIQWEGFDQLSSEQDALGGSGWVLKEWIESKISIIPVNAQRLHGYRY